MTVWEKGHWKPPEAQPPPSPLPVTGHFKPTSGEGIFKPHLWFNWGSPGDVRRGMKDALLGEDENIGSCTSPEAAWLILGCPVMDCDGRSFAHEDLMAAC